LERSKFSFVTYQGEYRVDENEIEKKTLLASNAEIIDRVQVVYTMTLIQE